MEYLPLGFAGLLGGTFLICSAAEFVLWLFERGSYLNQRSRRAQTSRQGSGTLSTPVAEKSTPIAKNPKQVAPSSSPADADRKPGILIADDHPLYRGLLETWFREHGFNVWSAADGREAVELHQAHAKEISLALLDVHMLGLDGPETLAALRQEAPSVPCCFMTANLSRPQEAHLLALGAANVFEKPFPLRETTATIRSIITQPGCSPAAEPPKKCSGRPVVARAIVTHTSPGEMFIHIPAGGSRAGTIELFGLATFWLALVAFYTMAALGLLAPGGPQGADVALLTCFSIPFWLVGFGMLAAAAWLAWGKKFAWFSLQKMVVQWRCLFWKRTRNVELNRVQRARGHIPAMQNKNTVGSYGAELVYERGSFVLDADSEEEEAWLVREVNDFLKKKYATEPVALEDSEAV
jgi:CheY-like chemotaxis protein